MTSRILEVVDCYAVAGCLSPLFSSAAFIAGLRAELNHRKHNHRQLSHRVAQFDSETSRVSAVVQRLTPNFVAVAS